MFLLFMAGIWLFLALVRHFYYTSPRYPAEIGLFPFVVSAGRHHFMSPLSPAEIGLFIAEEGAQSGILIGTWLAKTCLRRSAPR